jgi:MFS family permease
VRLDRLPAATQALLAAVVALAIADGSIVTLALPSLFAELGVTVEGLAAVIGVYTLVLALALAPAELARRRLGSAPIAVAGTALFALASAVCAIAGSLGLLLAGRAVQGVGAAALLVAAFALLGAGDPTRRGARIWGFAAVLGFAAGPALGGALTEAFDWRAIFAAQAPVGLAASLACLPLLGARRGAAEPSPDAWAAEPSPDGTGGQGGEVGRGSGAEEPPTRAPEPSARAQAADPGAAVRARSTFRGDLVALALLSAALVAVLFGLVLLLVAGWAYSPLAAAAAVSVLPLFALGASLIPGDPRLRAAVGCGLVGAGIATLAFLPDAAIAWTLAPTALAGAGIGLALPALAGELLPEREPGQAARNLAVRHAGITVALIALAPVIAGALDDSIETLQLQGTAVVLDAALPPQTKIELAPKLLGSVNAESPRRALRNSFAEARPEFEGEELAELDRLARQGDDTLVAGVSDAFRVAFLITAGLALVAILFVSPPPRRIPAIVAILAVAALLPVGYAIARERLGPEPVVIADPCEDRALPDVGGLSGLAQDVALRGLDAAACRFGSSREELVLALADDEARGEFEDEFGVDPRSPLSIIRGLIGGG